MIVYLIAQGDHALDSYEGKLIIRWSSQETEVQVEGSGDGFSLTPSKDYVSQVLNQLGLQPDDPVVSEQGFEDAEDAVESLLYNWADCSYKLINNDDVLIIEEHDPGHRRLDLTKAEADYLRDLLAQGILASSQPKLEAKGIYDKLGI